MMRVPCPNGTLILLTSDGFSALVDLYRRIAPPSCSRRRYKPGWRRSPNWHGDIETKEDPDGILFPRFKLSDDATALLLRA